MRIAILGASRGLGAELAQHIHKEAPDSVLLLSSRKEAPLKILARAGDWVAVSDFSNTDQQEKLIATLRDFKPETLFYVAGGGPFGAYEGKEWKDHLWAMEVNLLFPARVLHALMAEVELRGAIRKIVFVGSAIAGQRPDPKASSYAAAKHGLRGLITSIQAERPSVDIQLFEPGYMETDMLPRHAWPRQQGIAANPKDEARKLWQLSQSSVK